MFKHINFMSHYNTYISNRFSNMRTISQSFRKKGVYLMLIKIGFDALDLLMFFRYWKLSGFLKYICCCSSKHVFLKFTRDLGYEMCIIFMMVFWKALLNTFKRYKRKHLHNLNNHLNRSSHQSLLRKCLKRGQKY